MFFQYLSKAATRSAASTRSLASTLLLSTEKEWLAKSANELRREAKFRGLSQRGTKTDLARRIVQAIQQANVEATAQRPAPAQRTFSSGAVNNLEQVAPHDKFVPRQRYFLNIKIPEAREEVDPGATIPFLPDYYNSEQIQSEPSEADNKRPRVLTVASASTHVDGGPSHSLFETADAHTFEVDESQPNAQPLKPQGLVKGLLEDLELPMLAFPAPTSKRVDALEKSLESRHSELNDEEKRGLYVLSGIVAGGWILGKLFS
ncbi:hypothetical protein BS47DRAFT_1323613 [Hydnum rufescens UP504]|uniref:SAP domain-containing protein n=1 Tax=Hydnum rufescens UP504 TaxID=1448309 RepID=A0A9P6E236_9AGAM|nr:hypothetical protein BS47DRAFT_1323613 [Hydnum rufescens UP504]